MLNYTKNYEPGKKNWEYKEPKKKLKKKTVFIVHNFDQIINKHTNYILQIV